MPESHSRKKPKPATQAPPPPPKEHSNPTWFVPTFIALLVAGLVWVVTTYVSNAQWPIPGIGQANLFIGFGLIITGFLMTMRWR